MVYLVNLVSPDFICPREILYLTLNVASIHVGVVQGNGYTKYREMKNHFSDSFHIVHIVNNILHIVYKTSHLE